MLRLTLYTWTALAILHLGEVRLQAGNLPVAQCVERVHCGPSRSRGRAKQSVRKVLSTLSTGRALRQGCMPMERKDGCYKCTDQVQGCKLAGMLLFRDASSAAMRHYIRMSAAAPHVVMAYREGVHLTSRITSHPRSHCATHVSSSTSVRAPARPHGCGYLIGSTAR